MATTELVRAERIPRAPARAATSDRPWFWRLIAAAGPETLAAAVCAVGATTWSALIHGMLLYGDARAHLDVARHVTDGLRPGLAQLGSVWLPMPHLLLVPLVAVDWLWHSGAAGAVVGGCCFIYAASRVFVLVRELTGHRVAAWCGFAVFALNLNLLYLQSTALTEPVLLAFLIGAVLHLSRWLRTLSVRSLVAAGLFTFCATLTRYEGWVLLVTATAVVAGWTWHRRRERHEVEANVLIFAAIGGYGIVLWLLYNLIIFHDALYFMQSSYSAQSQQRVLAHVGLLTTSGDALRSVLTYGWTVIDVLGPAMTVVAVGGTLALALTAAFARRRGPSRTGVILVILAAPIAFNVLSLWLGQTTIRVPQVAPHGMWNDRYGVMALPFAAVCLGVCVARWRWAAPAVVALAAGTLLVMAVHTPITVSDGRYGTSSAADGHPELAAAFLRRAYRGGEVLADDSLASPFMFATGLDLRQFVTIGFEPWYDDAIRSPARTVAWAVAVDGDAVSTDMIEHPDRFRDFRLVFTQGSIRVYRRLATPATAGLRPRLR